jgi:hypothetical protein
MAKFRRSGASSIGASSDTLLPYRATNAWVVGASASDVSDLSTLGGWYGPWTPPLIHLHPRWPGPAGCSGHGGYHAGDDCYEGVDQKQNKQENRMVRYHKLDGPVSPRTAEALGQQHKQWVCKMVVSVDGSGAI